MDDNKIELTPEILDAISGGAGAEDVYAALEGLVKTYSSMGFSLEQLTQLIQSGGPMITQLLKDLPIEAALAFVTQKYMEFKGA